MIKVMKLMNKMILAMAMIKMMIIMVRKVVKIALRVNIKALINNFNNCIKILIIS